MDKYYIEGTPRTPTIRFDDKEGALLLEGRSSPENAREFYEPAIEWLDTYVENPAAKTSLTLNLEHFNTSTSKFLMEVFRRIRFLADNGHNYEIIWMYEEDDLEMLDTAETYEVMTSMRFKMVSYPETSI